MVEASDPVVSWLGSRGISGNVWRFPPSRGPGRWHLIRVDRLFVFHKYQHPDLDLTSRQQYICLHSTLHDVMLKVSWIVDWCDVMISKLPGGGAWMYWGASLQVPCLSQRFQLLQNGGGGWISIKFLVSSSVHALADNPQRNISSVAPVYSSIFYSSCLLFMTSRIICWWSWRHIYGPRMATKFGYWLQPRSPSAKSINLTSLVWLSGTLQTL